MAPQPPLPPPVHGVHDVRAEGASALDLQSTAALLDLARRGHAEALDALFARVLPRLRRWARGRLPGAARDLLDTEDVVQETIASVLRNLNRFESRHEGALQAYLRQAVLNRITGEARRVTRKPPGLQLDDVHQARDLSPLEALIGAESVDRYERALARLPAHYREAIVARLELRCSYQDVALALGKPNANSARSLVVRALYRLYEEMNRG